MPQAVRNRPARALSLVWSVPLLALLLAGYLLLREFQNRGPTITIVFDQAAGLAEGRTPVEYKGMAVGIVESLSLSPDLSQVVATVQLEKSARGLAREGSKFWILRPEIGFEGVRGLDTLISGPTIQVAPGVGPAQNEFTALPRPPLAGSDLGYRYVLTAERLGSLQPGSPVLYREIKVGEITATRLADDATHVLVEILVSSPYDQLVRANSVFWDASGIDLELGFLGASLSTDSLQTLLSGGISFATPEADPELAPLANENARFRLHSKPDDDWLEWQPSIRLRSP